MAFLGFLVIVGVGASFLLFMDDNDALSVSLILVALFAVVFAVVLFFGWAYDEAMSVHTSLHPYGGA